eukprot:CAMPEP_0172604728 /NCGR_PEP_ID=MMETSP1068-20121228/24984_1 /TAXON_ID=35684 /ORGANISM="Pseudopedinella elastica, Strain CCMP716" /LENGTH=704 /DNA_ID=CAMNT_0013406897 /DNA_START=1 /DNA_END=2115 /DNA_ORIENTATION=+
MSQFYNDMAASVLRADYTLYLVLAYLTLFRLEELTFTEYRKFIESQEPDKMSVFLSYTFDTEHLTNTVKWDWLKIFDLEYVEGSMLRPIAESAALAEKIRVDMLAKASGLAAEKEASEGRAGIPELPKKKLTRPVSPRLTKPAPRAVPLPEKIPQEVLAGKEPRYLDRTNVAQIESQKVERLALHRERTLKKYSESKIQPFKLNETRNTLRDARREAELKLASNLQFEAKPGPSKPVDRTAKKPEFRMNAAAYLREDSLYKKKQAEEAKIIEAYESELRDSTEYYQWQTEMREKDLQGRREQVERVRTLAKLSAEEAHLAMEKQRKDNADLATRIKAESAEMKRQKAFEADMNLLMNRQLIQEMVQVREHAPKEAQTRLLEQRKERRTVIHDEISTLLAEKKEEERRELAEREERARQLKAHREIKPPKVDLFDPTESVGLGLLDEMSHVEMKERLAINRVREEEREKSTRQNILSAKEKKDLNLRKRIDNIERIRAAATSANQASREKKREREKMEALKADEEKNRANLELLASLDARREATVAQRQALADEEERRQAAMAFGGQGGHASEEKLHQGLLLGAEREMGLRQGEAQKTSKIYEETKKKGLEMKEAQAKRTAASQRRFFASQAEEVNRKREELARKHKEDAASKKEAFLAQREKHKAIKEKIVGLNPYAQSLNEASKTKRDKQRLAQSQQVNQGNI